MEEIKSAKDYFEMIAKSKGHEKADDIVYKVSIYSLNSVSSL